MRGLAVATTVFVWLLAAVPACARPAVGLTTSAQLVEFDTSTPGTASAGPTVTGLQPGETILGIDFRPATGKLYGLGSRSRLYRINEATGHATQVGPQFPAALSGTSFGFDFNAHTDRIGVVSDAEQNFRLDPATAAQTVDNALAPAGSVGTASYSDAYDGAPSSTLWGIDYASDMLVRIGAANATATANGGAVATIGALGVDAGADVSLDVSFPAPVVFAAIGGSLYTIDLSSGAATLVGQISPSALALTGIAVKSMDPTLMALLSNNSLARVKASAPNTATPIDGSTALNPQFGELMGAIDYRPATGELYGLGSNSHVVKIDTSSGAWSPVGAAFTPALATQNFYGAGFDFLASEDRIRLTTDADQNEWLDPGTGQVVQAGPAVTPGSSAVTALAGDRNFAGATGSSTFGIDTTAGNLVRVQSDGTLTTVGSLNLGVNLDPRTSLDIVEPGLAFLDAIDPLLLGHTLYLVDLKTGRARFAGIFSPQTATTYVVGLSVVPPGRFEHGSAAPSVSEAAVEAGLVVQRAAGSEGRATVEYATSDGSATAGEDYTPVSGMLDFAAGETSKTVNVPITNDGAVEGPETFSLTLTDATNGAYVAPGVATATVTIASDDATPSNPPDTTPPSGGSPPPASPLPAPAASVPSEPDSAIRVSAKAAAKSFKAISGTASDPDGDLARVEVALVRLVGGAKAARAGCQALQANGRLKTVKLVRGRCRPVPFIKASGLARWSLRLPRRLPAGSYVVYSRAVDKGGRRETQFSAADGNRRAFKLR
jgi:hypothetical protein